MALEDEVQSRFGSSFLTALTNPQNTAATTVDTTRLGLAADDVEALFSVHCGVAYDNSNAIHKATAIPTVVDILRVYSGQMNYEDAERNFVQRFRNSAQVLGRDRISAETDSLLNPTEDTSGDLPAFDRSQFQDYRPGAPAKPSPLD